MKIPLIIAICAGLIVSGGAWAAETNFKQRASGASFPTMVDTNGDGIGANAVSFQVKGKLGSATLLGFAEFTDFAPYGIDGCDLRAALVQESFVETFNDGSMLFFVATSGFNCLNLATFEVGGEFVGTITGGTGRFAGATGSWTTQFDAFLVGQFMNAFTATTTGTIEVPHGHHQ